jgi:hypothetical protein
VCLRQSVVSVFLGELNPLDHPQTAQGSYHPVLLTVFPLPLVLSGSYLIVVPTICNHTCSSPLLFCYVRGKLSVLLPRVEGHLALQFSLIFILPFFAPPSPPVTEKLGCPLSLTGFTCPLSHSFPDQTAVSCISSQCSLPPVPITASPITAVLWCSPAWPECSFNFPETSASPERPKALPGSHPPCLLHRTQSYCPQGLLLLPGHLEQMLPLPWSFLYLTSK